MVFDPITMIKLPDKGYYEWVITRPDDDKMLWIIDCLEPGISDLVDIFVENYDNYINNIVNLQISNPFETPMSSRLSNTTEDLNKYGEKDEA